MLAYQILDRKIVMVMAKEIFVTMIQTMTELMMTMTIVQLMQTHCKRTVMGMMLVMHVTIVLPLLIPIRKILTMMEMVMLVMKILTMTCNSQKA